MYSLWVFDVTIFIQSCTKLTGTVCMYSVDFSLNPSNNQFADKVCLDDVHGNGIGISFGSFQISSQ